MKPYWFLTLSEFIRAQQYWRWFQPVEKPTKKEYPVAH